MVSRAPHPRMSVPISTEIHRSAPGSPIPAGSPAPLNASSCRDAPPPPSGATESAWARRRSVAPKWSPPGTAALCTDASGTASRPATWTCIADVPSARALIPRRPKTRMLLHRRPPWPPLLCRRSKSGRVRVRRKRRHLPPLRLPRHHRLISATASTETRRTATDK